MHNTRLTQWSFLLLGAGMVATVAVAACAPAGQADSDDKSTDQASSSQIGSTSEKERDASPSTSDTEASAVQFSIANLKLVNGYLSFSIDTSLPDIAEVLVSIRRTYDAINGDGSSATYSMEYFEESGQISQWRESRRIFIDDVQWMEQLQAHMDKMSLISKEMSFEVESINSHITISINAYAHKTGNRYGAREYESMLDRVQDIERVGSEKQQVMQPFTNFGNLPLKSQKVGFDGLEQGLSYRLIADQVPLMSKGPTDTKAIEDIMPVMYLPTDTIVYVIDVERSGLFLFYYVKLPEYQSQEGWINSDALIQGGVYRLSDS